MAVPVRYQGRDVDSSQIIYQINGVTIPGVQDCEHGGALDPKAVMQSGDVGPRGHTKGKYKGEGSIKLLKWDAMNLKTMLFNLGGQLDPASWQGIEVIVAIQVTAPALTSNVSLTGCRIHSEKQTMPASDSSDPFVCEFTLTFKNRIVDGIPDWISQAQLGNQPQP
jgi:hypothetical protein